MTRKIEIKLEDVIAFVLERSDRDPIEIQIDDSRYEVMNFGIYDHKLGRHLPQNISFKDFSEEVYHLRKRRISTQIKKSFCKALMELAPTEVYL